MIFLFGEYGQGFLSGTVGLILYVIMVFAIAILIPKLRPIFKKVDPLYGWYMDLPEPLRKTVSGFFFILYFAACIALIVYISS